MNFKKHLLTISLVILALILFWVFGVVQPRSNILGITTTQLETKEKIVALTFDDGPSPQYTEQVLGILEAKQVPATFFLVGENIDKYPAVAKKVYEQGHEIGNHSYTHFAMAFMTPQRIRAEISVTAEKIFRLTGATPATFRVPYGWYSPFLPQITSQNNLEIIGWNIDSLDWKKPGVNSIVNNVVGNIEPGSIILMHDGSNEENIPNRDQTVAALPQIIDSLREKGYIFLTVSELLSHDQYQVANAFSPISPQ